jgi:hypothetical protein
MNPPVTRKALDDCSVQLIQADAATLQRSDTTSLPPIIRLVRIADVALDGLAT